MTNYKILWLPARKEFFLRIYPENMIAVGQHYILKNCKSLSFIKITIKYKISLINFTVHGKNLENIVLYYNYHIFSGQILKENSLRV